MTSPSAQHLASLPALGFGLGLRACHYDEAIEAGELIDWYEVISENVMDQGGYHRQKVREFARHFPIVLHGVSMNLGNPAGLDRAYLDALKTLRDEVNAPWVSDHLCLTGVHGINTHQLLPVLYTKASLKVLVANIRHAQEYLECPLLLENPSTYMEYEASTLHEADFYARVCEEADCGMLLDVNNVYVSCFNHDLDAREYLARLPFERVKQMHMAGHQHKGTHILDTHDSPVCDDVWQLFADCVVRAPKAAVMVEWDERIPAFSRLCKELQRCREVARNALQAAEEEVGHG